MPPTYRVSKNGSDSNDGSINSPFLTIAKLNTLAATPRYFPEGTKILFDRGGEWQEQLAFVKQGGEGGKITIGAYGDSANPDPKILDPGGLGIFQGLFTFDSCFGVIEVVDIAFEGDYAASVSGISFASNFPNICAAIRVKDCSFSQLGQDGVSVGLLYGNGRISPSLVDRCSFSKIGDNGVGIYGAVDELRTTRSTFREIGVGDGDIGFVFGGDAISAHNTSARIIADHNDIDQVVDGIHHINYPSGIASIIAKNYIRGYTESAIEINDYEAAASPIQRLDFIYRNIIHHSASASGQGAIVIGRDGVVGGGVEDGTGGIGSAYILFNSIQNAHASAPIIFASWANAAAVNDAFLVFGGNIFDLLSTGKYVQLTTRGIYAPRIKEKANLYRLDGSGKWSRNGTSYNAAGWYALGYGTSPVIGDPMFSGDADLSTADTNAHFLAGSDAMAAAEPCGVDELPINGMEDSDYFDEAINPRLTPDFGAVTYFPMSTTKKPAAFYRGYELGNGIHDWIANPAGGSFVIPRNTLYANRASIQQIGANTYWTIAVNAFRFGADNTPKDLHVWWDELIRNIWYNDPSMFSNPISELVLIESKTHDEYVLAAAAAADDVSMDLVSSSGLVDGDILFIYDSSADTDRDSDVVQIQGSPSGGTVTFNNIRTGYTGLSASYDPLTAKVYKAEAAYKDVFLEAAPDIGPAEDGSRGNFRTAIPFRFLTNSDRYTSS